MYLDNSIKKYWRRSDCLYITYSIQNCDRIIKNVDIFVIYKTFPFHQFIIGLASVQIKMTTDDEVYKSVIIVSKVGDNKMSF